MFQRIHSASPATIAVTGAIAAILSVAAAGFSASFLRETGIPVPDMILHLFLAHPESAFRLYGDLSATSYWRVQGLDMLLPAAYGFFLAMLSGRLGADRSAGAIISRAWMLPIAAAVADYAENLLIALYTRAAPVPGFAAGAAIATLLKWLLLAFSITVLMILVFRSIYLNVNNHGRQRLDGGNKRKRNKPRKKKNN
jgi:uncharacterized membrane protein YoaK (UPF0700 family)